MKRNLFLSLLVLLLLTVLVPSFLASKDKDKDKEEEQPYIRPEVYIHGEISPKAKQPYTYDWYLIDAEGKKLDSGQVTKTFPKPGPYTVEVKVQGYSGSLKVVARRRKKRTVRQNSLLLEKRRGMRR